jgi:hypothetical protein
VFHVQTAIILLAQKRAHRVTDVAFDVLCKYHHAAGPQTDDNYYPRSYWLMKKVAGVQDARQVQVGLLKTAGGSSNVACKQLCCLGCD